MKQKPAVCLTFDLEEFDLPLEYKQQINTADQFAKSNEGINALLPVLKEHMATFTFFTTANYAINNTERVKELTATQEIASHSFFHSSFKEGDLLKSKQELERITGKEVLGFRMPRMARVNYKDLLAAGYQYDSSLHPTWLPGRYNHFKESKTIFKKDGITVFPASVTPGWRTPLFWLSFKNFSNTRYLSLVKKCLSAYGYVNIYIHPWEFADISSYKLPGYIAKDHTLMLTKLKALLDGLKNEARFITVKELLQERNEL